MRHLVQTDPFLQEQASQKLHQPVKNEWKSALRTIYFET